MNGVELGIGARLIAQAQVLHDARLGLNGETVDQMYDADLMLRDQLDLLEICHGLTLKFAASPFNGNQIKESP